MPTNEPPEAFAEEGLKKQPRAERQFRLYILHGNGLQPGVPLNSNADLEDYLDDQTLYDTAIFKVI